MIQKAILPVTALLFTAISIPAAQAEEEADPRRGEKVNRICFSRNIDSFSSPSRKSVILETGPNRQYLVETGSCFQLDRAQRIAIDGATSCLSRGDRLIVSENMFNTSTGLPPDRCFVKAIYEWDEDAEMDEDEDDDAAE